MRGSSDGVLESVFLFPETVCVGAVLLKDIDTVTVESGVRVCVMGIETDMLIFDCETDTDCDNVDDGCESVAVFLAVGSESERLESSVGVNETE